MPGKPERHHGIPNLPSHQDQWSAVPRARPHRWRLLLLPQSSPRPPLAVPGPTTSLAPTSLKAATSSCALWKTARLFSLLSPSSSTRSPPTASTPNAPRRSSTASNWPPITPPASIPEAITTTRPQALSRYVHPPQQPVSEHHHAFGGQALILCTLLCISISSTFLRDTP